MKFTRHLDELNRIVLPYEVSQFGWTQKTQLDMLITPEQTVVLSIHRPFCSLCGDSEGELIPVEKHSICVTCLETALRNQQNKVKSIPKQIE
jgi:bifunctional DNA-binding transcriptional regulator/antitoxin component of YhaV-PrlF toxin-antitoxin module